MSRRGSDLDVVVVCLLMLPVISCLAVYFIEKVVR
jgi:hypothetical protein